MVIVFFLLGVSHSHLMDELSATVSAMLTNGSLTLISMSPEKTFLRSERIESM